LGLDSLCQAARSGTSWLWHGILARGATTLLTSQWKAGKTTLAAILLARLKSGGKLAGLDLAAGRAVVVSEESHSRWVERARKLGIGDHVGWFCRPFRGRPSHDDWLHLLDRLADAHARQAFDLLLIDPLAAFSPSRTENDAASMLEVLMPLQQLTTLGLSILAAHHPRKRESAPGQAARGSGALSGYADILLEMNWYNRDNRDDRRRKLESFSRYDETPRQLVIELTADGTDYISHGSFQEEEFAGHWLILLAILGEAPRKLTRREIRKQWPPGKVPDDGTVYRWLERAEGQGLVCKDGTGRRNSPFRYWLPGREEHWRKDPLAFLHMPELFDPPAATGPAETL
jgi:hypothetical protein